MAKRINIIGQTFNNWRVDAYVGESKYRCTCLLCNRQFDVNSFSLRSGSSKNCTMCSINTRKKKYTVNSYSKLQISCIRDIENLLRENNIEYNTESDNTTNSYDFILYDYNIVISFILTIDNTDNKILQNKMLSLREKKIRLINIFEYEWRNEEKRKFLREFIIANTTKSNINKIYARNTSISIIDNTDARRFLDINHLQGYVAAEYNIVLMHKNEIVALMSFGRPRFSSESEYELLRLAFKRNTIINGGSEKMFKYFINKFKPLSILSYCAITKFGGEVYNKLGFEKVEVTPPNYRWVDPVSNTNYARYQCMKQKLIAKGFGTENDTENSMMRNHGYCKVYDAGNEKYIWKMTDKQLNKINNHKGNEVLDEYDF